MNDRFAAEEQTSGITIQTLQKRTSRSLYRAIASSPSRIFTLRICRKEALLNAAVHREAPINAAMNYKHIGRSYPNRRGTETSKDSLHQ